MQITVSIRGAIVVDNNVHTFNINATSENIGRHKDTLFECFESSVSVDAGTRNETRLAMISWKVHTAPLVGDQSGY